MVRITIEKTDNAKVAQNYFPRIFHYYYAFNEKITIPQILLSWGNLVFWDFDPFGIMAFEILTMQELFPLLLQREIISNEIIKVK